MIETKDVILLLLGIPASIFSAYLYDIFFRNSSFETPMIVQDDTIIKSNNRYVVIDEREANRKKMFNLFLIIFGLYLSWLAVFVPFMLKNGIFMHKEYVDLSSSNLALLLNIQTLQIEWENIKIFAVALSLPILLIGLKFSAFVAKIMTSVYAKFYVPTDKNWSQFRAFSYLGFLCLVLSIEVYLITNNSFTSSLTIGLVVYFALLAKATEKQ